MRNLITLLLASLFICQISAQVTLDNLLSAPFYSQITVAPNGQRVAWVKNERGVRNIQIADAPDWKPRNVTNQTADDGLEINGLEWLSDSENLLYVRGNAPQVRAREPHNPAHLMESAAPMIWKLTVTDGKKEQIGNGSTPSVFGDKLVFNRGGQVFFKDLKTNDAPRQLFQVRNGASQVRWSPDGSKLAFVSSRGEHSFVGVYDFDKKDYQFLSPSAERDNEPCWSPDGKQIAFIKQPRNIETDVIFFPVRSAPAWSIVVADVATGKTKTVFTRPQNSIGQAYQPHTGKQQLLWTATNQILFVGEQTGWQQLYAINLADGKTTALTEGEFEVDEIQLSADRKRCFIVSNQNDLDRKHIYLVDFQQITEGVQRLTLGKTIEAQIALLPDAKTIFAIQTSGTMPTQVVKITDGQIQALTELPLRFPQKELVNPDPLQLKAMDGVTFYNQVFYPKNLKQDRSHAALIFVHGGSRRQMLMGYHQGQYYANAYHLSQYFAAQGVVVAHINYRSGIGYGWDFREAKGYGASGCAEFQDLEMLGEWLKKHPSVNPSKITVWGGSYGGYMTAHALGRRSDLFVAGVDMHGVHNWNTAIQTFQPDYDSLRTPLKGQSAFKSSPMNYVEGWQSPVLFIHGDDDANVNFLETETITRVLRRKGVDFEQFILPDEVHSFLRYESWLKAYERTAAFLEQKVYKK
jgi:dipeptidyl aminopeptidase/acylaminoacyl peptidase